MVSFWEPRFRDEKFVIGQPRGVIGWYTRKSRPTEGGGDHPTSVGKDVYYHQESRLPETLSEGVYRLLQSENGICATEQYCICRARCSLGLLQVQQVA